MKKWLPTTLLFLILVTVMPLAAASAEPVTVPLRFDHYYSYDMVVTALQALHRAYPRLTVLDEVGKSEEGRSIYCLTINNPATGKALDKPGVYVDGNIHGNEIQGGEVCLYLLDYLLGHYGQNPEVTRLVDTRCFYVVPVVNVDGRYHFFADANNPNSNRGLRRPHDDDHDGLVDEDFPEDLDGDGNICQMRRKDPFGSLKTDPEDPRLMIRIKPGEKGEWSLLGNEGIDNDNDGRVNEDAEGYVDGNRNWGFDWMPSYVQSGAGDYPFSGTGILALARFINERPNICVAWAFHNFGGMYLRGPSAKSEGEYPPGDIAVYDYLGKTAEKITPGYRYMLSWRDLYTTYGDFGGFMTRIEGAYLLVGELYMSDQERFNGVSAAVKPKGDEDEEGGPRFGRDPERDRERLKFNDHLAMGELYKPWKAFHHPQFGDVEIGGWVKMSTRLPVPFMLEELVHRNASAVIFSAQQTPEVRLEVLDTTRLANGLQRVRIRLANATAMPTMAYQARQDRLYPEDMLTIGGPGIKVLAGGKITDPDRDTVDYKEHRPDLQFLVVPGFGKVDYQFLVSGTGPVTVHYHSRHAGSLETKLELK